MRSAIFCGLLLCATGAAGQTLRLRSGADMTSAVVSFDGETLLLSDGKRVPRAELSEIQFALKGAEKSVAVAADPKDVERGRELFRQAEEFGARYPGSEGVILLEEKAFRIKEDGTWVERSRFAGRVLKESLKASWGEVQRSYEEGRERVKIVKATVYHPDGSVFPLDTARIRATRPQSGELFFDENRLLSYSMPEVEVGSIVEYEVEYETYNPFRKDFFFPSWGFQNFEPTLVSRFSVSLPAERKLYYSARNFSGAWKARAKPRVATEGAMTTYSWEMNEAPPIISEPSMVQYADIVPIVKVALFKDWGPVFEWLSKMYEERTRPNEELAAFARGLVKDCRSDDEKAASIYHYVQKEIRYIAVKIGVASGWGGYDANLTWKRRYGCCIDKALLMTAMLKAVGIASSPAILDPNSDADHDFQVPDIWFGHAITFLTVAGRSFFLDSTGHDYRYPALSAMDHGVKALNVFARKIDLIPTPRPEDHSTSAQYVVDISSSGDASVRFAEAWRGAPEGGARGYFKRLKESELKRYLQEWINSLGASSSELLDYRVENLDELSKPFSLSMTYRLTDYLIKAGDLYIMALPDLEMSFSEVALEKRRYDLEYETSLERRYHYEVSLPAGFTAASVLAPETLKGPGESFERGCLVKDRRIVCEAVLRRERRRYAPADYAAHKRFLERASRLTKDRLFLKSGASR